MPVKIMAKGFDAKAWERHEPDPDGTKYPFDVTYEGAVLGTFERNGYHDSDFYAIVWDDETETVTYVYYATTSGWTYPNSATVDATDEVWDKVRDWFEKIAYERDVRKDEHDAQVPSTGKLVRVTKGRTRGKRPIATGTLGWVVGTKPGYSHGPVYSEWAKPEDDVILQVLDDDGKHTGTMAYIGISRVEVVDPDQYRTDDEILRDRAKRSADTVRRTKSTGYIRGLWER